MDHLFRIETLVDPMNIWKERKAKDVVITDNKDYVFPRRIKTKNDYMEDWINTKSFIKAQNFFKSFLSLLITKTCVSLDEYPVNTATKQLTMVS
jgi:hypothetical protein